MSYPFYTVEFTVEVSPELANDSREAAMVAWSSVAHGNADCLVTEPSVESPDDAMAPPAQVTEIDLNALPSLGMDGD